MNYLGHKQKSLFLSIFIHTIIALLVFAFLYDKHQKSSETRTLIHLSAIHQTIPKLAYEPIPKKIIKKVQKKKIVTKPKIKKITPIVKKKKVFIKKYIEPKIVVVPVKVKEEYVKEKKELIAKASIINEIKDNKVSKPTVVKVSHEEKYINEHISLINSLIKKNLSYPRSAKKRGKQGRVFVSFILNLNGEVSELEASGKVSSILKKSAIKTIKKASQKFPHPHTVLALSIPISYKLK